MGMYQIAKDKAFLVAVKGIVFNEKGEILVLKVDNKLSDAAKWDFPGGLMDYDDTVESALKRELEEEISFTPTQYSVLACSQTEFLNFTFQEDDTRDVRVVIIGFKVLFDSASQIVLSEEHSEYRWVAQKDLLTLSLSRPTKALVESM